MKSLSRVRLLATPWTAAYQAPPSVGFSRQEYWSGLPFPSPEDLPNPDMEPRSLALQVNCLPSEPPRKLHTYPCLNIICQMAVNHVPTNGKLLGRTREFRVNYTLRVSTEKAMATHSSTHAWKIPWTEEPGKLQSMGSLGVGHD